MFISKFIKLLGHYIRYPVDILLLPVSILFGYFHGGIKMYAVLTLNVVSFPFPKVCRPAPSTFHPPSMLWSQACCVQKSRCYAISFLSFPFLFIYLFFPRYFIDITALFTVSVRKQ